MKEDVLFLLSNVLAGGLSRYFKNPSPSEIRNTYCTSWDLGMSLIVVHRAMPGEGSLMQVR